MNYSFQDTGFCAEDFLVQWALLVAKTLFLHFCKRIAESAGAEELLVIKPQLDKFFVVPHTKSGVDQ